MKRFFHTIGAMMASTLIFLLVMYLVAPIAEGLLDWFAAWFIPQGKQEVDDPSFLTLLGRGWATSSLASYAALYGARRLFENATATPVVVFFLLFLLAYTLLFTVVYWHHSMAESLIMPLVMAPAFYFPFHYSDL